MHKHLLVGWVCLNHRLVCKDGDRCQVFVAAFVHHLIWGNNNYFSMFLIVPGPKKNKYIEQFTTKFRTII